MKKLMFAVVAGLCSAVFADTVTSANIVGYAQGEAAYGYKVMGPSFKTVGGGDFDIQAVKPIAPASEDGLADWTYYIYEMSDGGACDGKCYVYMLEANGDVAEDGWYDSDDVTQGKVQRKFKQGEGLVFDVDFEGAGVQTAGEVDVGDVVAPAVYGYCPMVNPYATQLSIQGIAPVPPEGAGESDDWTYYIYALSDGGACDGKCYVYMYTVNGDVEEDGWYDSDDTTQGKVNINFGIGEGFVFDVDFEGAGAAFTSPLK